jgi:hypothetical protein
MPRYECSAEGFEANWVEVADRWTRREVETIYATAVDQEYVALLQAKTTACHIVLSDGSVIDDVQTLTYDLLLDADEIVLGWLGGVLPAAIARRRILGNASVRLSSNSRGIAARMLPPRATSTTTSALAEG